MPDCFLDEERVPAYNFREAAGTRGVSDLWPDSLRDIECANELPQGCSGGHARLLPW